MGIEERITHYLSSGGLFNPEMMEHVKVRDLIRKWKLTTSSPSSANTAADYN